MYNNSVTDSSHWEDLNLAHRWFSPGQIFAPTTNSVTSRHDIDMLSENFPKISAPVHFGRSILWFLHTFTVYRRICEFRVRRRPRPPSLGATDEIFWIILRFDMFKKWVKKNLRKIQRPSNWPPAKVNFNVLHTLFEECKIGYKFWPGMTNRCYFDPNVVQLTSEWCLITSQIDRWLKKLKKKVFYLQKHAFWDWLQPKSNFGRYPS